MTEYLNEIIYIFQENIKNFELLYDIQKNMIDNYNKKNLNFEILNNIKYIDNNKYFNDLDKINDKYMRITEIFEIYRHFEKDENIKNLKRIIINDENKNELKSENYKNEIHIL